MNAIVIILSLALIQIEANLRHIDPELVASVDKLFYNERKITMLSASSAPKFVEPVLLSLTSGGTTKKAYDIHTKALKVLDTQEKLLNSNLTEAQLLSVYASYRVPDLYCPEKNYNYFRCDDSYPYRSMDGSCNNLRIPWWGKKETPFKRLLPAKYDDGFNSPKTEGVKKKLPNPREIAIIVHSSRRTFPETSQFLTFFGQFVDHDLTLTSRTSDKYGTEKKCGCNTVKDSDCFPIPIPSIDKWNTDQKCMPFTRSSAAIHDFECKFNYREQLNLITAWLDLSPIYGSTVKLTKNLRSFENGTLKSSFNSYTNTEDLPRLAKTDCMRVNWINRCYLTGEKRTEENHYMTLFQKLFLTEHNRIARILNYLNPDWEDEEIFQEARKINIAQYNHIIYFEFLPTLLGNKAMTKWDLIPLKNGFFNDYDYKINPQVSNEFATAAMRFGHVLTNTYHYGYNNNYELVGNWTTGKMLFSHEFGYKNNYENILKGALLQNSYYFSPAVNNYLNHHLFENLTSEFRRLSLPALNIQRGRDHGLPGYNKYRKYCGLKYAYSFKDFDNIPVDVRYRIESIYDHPDDVDLFVGAMSEYPTEDGVVGETVACILAQGFRDWKHGDRFYYENNNPVNGFTLNQLNEIRRASMARILCDNSDLAFVQRIVFLEANEETNPLIDCQQLYNVNYNEWKIY